MDRLDGDDETGQSSSSVADPHGRVYIQLGDDIPSSLVCQACELLSLPHQDTHYYSTIAPGYDRLHREEQERKIRVLVQRMTTTPACDVLLDVGCGTGFALSMWPVCEAYGVEPSAEMVQQGPADVQRRICVAPAESLASIFRPHVFDVVVSVTAIHNFTDMEAGLIAMKHVGKESFAFSVLKRSAKLEEIDALVHRHFIVKEVIESDPHDRMYLARTS